MLKAGWLIEFGGRRGVVRRVDRRVGVAHVETTDGYVELQTSADGADEPRLIADLPSDWPVLHVPDRPRYGAFLTLMREGEALVPLVDFVPTSVGGRISALFINPEANLSVGEVLVAQYARGMARVDVKRPLLTVAAVTTRAEDRIRVVPETTVYDQIESILDEGGQDE